MEIKSVKIQTINNEFIGYKVNGNSFFPKENCELIKQWIADDNTPEPEFTEEELNEQRIQAIKAKASELITSKYSMVWQLNHPRTDSRYINEYAWIDNIRAISNMAEANGINVKDIQWQ